MPSKTKIETRNNKILFKYSHLLQIYEKIAPKLGNSTTTPIIVRERCFPKRELWARLHYKDKEIMKLKLEVECQ